MYNQTCWTSTCAAQSVGTGNQLFVSLVNTILAAQCAISPPGMWPRDYGGKVAHRKSNENSIKTKNRQQITKSKNYLTFHQLNR